MFSKNLKIAREKHGLAQWELAESVGVNQSYIAQLELGYKDPPSGKVLVRIADVLECSVDWLLGRER